MVTGTVWPGAARTAANPASQRTGRSTRLSGRERRLGRRACRRGSGVGDGEFDVHVAAVGGCRDPYVVQLPAGVAEAVAERVGRLGAGAQPAQYPMWIPSS